MNNINLNTEERLRLMSLILNPETDEQNYRDALRLITISRGLYGRYYEDDIGKKIASILDNKEFSDSKKIDVINYLSKDRALFPWALAVINDNSPQMHEDFQMKAFEKIVDQLFSKFDIDFKFTSHFGDRMVDKRNVPLVTLKDLAATIKKLYEKADRVLIDAPCSGLGVLKRNPDSKWKLQPEFTENIKKTQQEVLENYSKMVKPGGKLVYATCSILPSENQEQVQKFLTTKTVS